MKKKSFDINMINKQETYLNFATGCNYVKEVPANFMYHDGVSFRLVPGLC